MKLILVFLVVFLMSCFHGENSESDDVSCTNNEFDFSGCWVTQECKQAADTDGNLIDKWLKSQYNFDSNGKILIDVAEYGDSSCSGIANDAPFSGESPNIDYEVVGEVTIESGILGTEINIVNLSISQDIEFDGVIIVTDNDELCSTKSFYFGPGLIRLSEDNGAKSTSLFENCLVRGQLP